MDKLIKKTFTALLAAGLSVASATAALTYRVDTDAKHIIFDGFSAPGAPGKDDGPVGDYTLWEVGNGQSLNDSAYANRHSGTVSYTEGASSTQLLLIEVDQNNGAMVMSLDIMFDSASGALGVLTLDNLTFSYASFRADMQNFIEALVINQRAMTLNDATGNGFGDIAYAIPEPAHVAAVLGAGVLLAGAMLRRRAR